MKSTSTPSSPATTIGSNLPTIQMDLHGISASCKGKYEVSTLGASGNIVSSVSSSDDPLHLQVDVASAPLIYNDGTNSNNEKDSTNNTIKPSSLPFPTLATFSSCQSKVSVHDLQFTGSISAKVIGLFSGVIQDKVTDALNEHLCSLIKKNGESVFDKALHVAREYVEGLLGNVSLGDDGGVYSFTKEQSIDKQQQLNLPLSLERSSPQVFKSGNVVHWDRDMPLMKRILLGINNFASNHLNEGIIIPILQRLNTWQATTTANCDDCGFFFKGVNGLIKSLTKGTGSLDFVVPETILNLHHNHTFSIPNYGDIMITAQSVKVSGLDNFTELSLFRPVGDNLLSSVISSTSGLNVSILMEIEVKPANGGAFRGDALHETFELKFNTSEVNIDVESAVEFDREMFGKLSVGSFMFGSYTVFDNNRNILNCVLEALTSIVFTDMKARMNIDGMHLSPYVPSSEQIDTESLEDNIDELFNNVLQLLLLEYSVTVTESLAGIIQAPVRSLLNTAMANYIGDTKMYPLHCVNIEIPEAKVANPLRFDDNRAMLLFDEVVNQESAITEVNSFIECVEKVIDVERLFNGCFYNLTLGEMKFQLHDLHYENTDSVYELAVLHPDGHYHLQNSLGYGKCTANTKDDSCTMTSFSFGVTVAHVKRGYMGNINAHLKMMNLNLHGGTELKFDMNWLPHLKISDLLAHPQCLSIPATNFRFFGFNATVDMLELSINATLNNGGEPHMFAYKTEDSTELATAISTLMSEGAQLLQNALDEASKSLLEEGSQVCSTPANPQRTHTHSRSTGSAGVWTFLFVMAFVIGNAWLFMRGFKDVEDKEEAMATNKQASAVGEVGADEEPEFPSMTEPLLDDNDEMNEVLVVESPPRKFPFASSSSLMFHPSIHPTIKYGFPGILALALVLFIASNATVGASVDLIVTKANGMNLTSLINIYAFSLGSTMREMAQAGVYLLMLLILFCSGVWPYIKVFVLFLCWITSTRRLPPVRREKILYLLDSLGKFSLIDAYVLVLMMVAFRYQLEVENLGQLNVYVTPKFGFYSFLFATIVSLVSGHAMLFFHRKAMIPRIPVYSGRRESLGKHIFDDKHGRGLVRLTRRFRRTVVLLILLALMLICVGVSLKSFHFTFSGVAGTALGESSVRRFSLVSIGESIPQSVQDSSTFGIYWIQTCYFLFALVNPLVCLVSLFLLFVYPMTMKRQQKMFVLAEITNAWSAIEVFCIAVNASLLEISPFAKAMVGEHCSLLNHILSGWSGDNRDNLHQCFAVKSSIDGSSAVLIIGVILNSLLTSTLHRFAHHAMWERIEREDRPDATEDETRIVRENVLSHTFISRIRKSRLNAFILDEVSFGPVHEYEDFENVVESEGPDSAHFWQEWRKIVSVI
eukprot:scaffold1593_cov193-Alexandrium_tamarense.AAC.67